MTLFEILYFSLVFTGLGLLCLIVWKVGEAMADCPATGRAARAGALTIMTGFAALGFGVISLIAAIFPLLQEGNLSLLYTALGPAAIALGIGFTFAAGQLRAVVRDAATRAAHVTRQTAAPGTTGTDQATA